MNKKRWFVGTFVLLFAAILAGQASAATITTGGSTPIVAGNPFAVPSNIEVRETFPGSLVGGFDINTQMFGVDVNLVNWNYKNVFVRNTQGFATMFPGAAAVALTDDNCTNLATSLMDANDNGKLDIQELWKKAGLTTPTNYACGHPVATVTPGGFSSIFDVRVTNLASGTMRVVPYKPTTAGGSPGTAVIPMDAANFFSANMSQVPTVGDPEPLNAKIPQAASTAGATPAVFQIASVFDLTTVVGGSGQGADVSATVPESTGVVGVLLDVSPDPAVTGQLYVSVEAPDLLPGYLFFRPLNLVTPGQYVQLAAIDGEFVEGAAEWYYKTGTLSPTDPDEGFIIGLEGVTSGEPVTLVISSWIKADTGNLLDDLQKLQTVTLTITP